MIRFILSAFAAALLLNASAAPAQEKTMTTSTGIELVWIPPGEFMLGSTPEEREWAITNGAPERSVKVEGDQPRRTKIASGFWLGRTEVTIGQWRKFVEATSYVTDTEKAGEASLRDRETRSWVKVKGVSWRDPRFATPLTEAHPACYISWRDATAFCDWLTEAEKKTGKLQNNFVCRLPTESEWEYACRAGTQTKFWWGDKMEEGNGRLNRGDRTAGFDYTSPADHYGAKGCNLFGLADMLGNVWEWCLDDVDPVQAHAECYKGNSNARVLRGGSFSDARTTRCAYRRGLPPMRGDCEFGFRVCIGVANGSGEPSTNTAPLVAAVPPAEMPPPPPQSSAPGMKATTPPPPLPPATAGPTRAPATSPVATAKTSPPAAHVVGVKQTTFEISNISGSSQYAYVNNAWIRNVPCVQVTLRVNENVNKNPPDIKAYFYNKDRELVKELKRPTSVSFGNRESFTSPERFQPGKKYTVYFGASESIQRGKDKWKHVVVVFGNRECATAEIHPKEDIALFDYPEKELVMKGRGGR